MTAGQLLRKIILGIPPATVKEKGWRHPENQNNLDLNKEKGERIRRNVQGSGDENQLKVHGATGFTSGQEKSPLPPFFKGGI